MAAVGQLSRVLLRSALTQSRRQFSAAAAEHGEHSGTCVVITRCSSLVRFIQTPVCSCGDLVSLATGRRLGL